MTQVRCRGGGEVKGLPLAQNNFRNHLELVSNFGKSSEPVRHFFQSLEKFPNIFNKNSKHLKKFPNLFGIFFKKPEKFPNIFKFVPNSFEMLCNYLDNKCLET